MGKIVLLDSQLANRIAAGEVVERPASVVKELVENSIDAKATKIEIILEEAGLTSIRVIDNGVGIEADDVEKAFLKNATSKIKTEYDLFRIRTLGFRGEALPSIASVSQLELTTSTGDAGVKLVNHGGVIQSIEGASARRGTDILVQNLFYNTPARLKYVKTIPTELGNITDIVNRLALSHPEISFTLTHNNKRILQTNGNNDVRQVLAAIYGMDIAKKMIPIKTQSLDYKIEGFICIPEVTRASRNYISTMINHRYIKNYVLVKAILEGYHTLLPIGRYPICYLSISMDPLLVDVNVHPTKMEVRLSKEQELYELIKQTIKEAFSKQTLIPTTNLEPKKAKIDSEQIKLELDTILSRPARIETPPKTIKETLVELQLYDEKPMEPVVETKMEEPISHQVKEEKTDFLEEDSFPSMHEEETQTVESTNDSFQHRIPPMYPIGQMHGTYIFAQNEEGLFIIDQHAAQERIKYEYFREKVGQVTNELQQLLLPITFHYAMDEYVKIKENIHLLEEVGVFLEEFGQNSFLIRSHPTWFIKGNEKEIIEELIEQLLEMKQVDIKKLREEAAIMMSCKASIKANRHLRMDEIEALIHDLRQCEDPFTCPHGRPIIIKYTTYDMEKMFKRVM